MTAQKPINIYFDCLKKINAKEIFSIEILREIIKNLFVNYISKDEQTLLRLAFKKDLHQEELDNFLASWDIEAHGADKALVLAYIIKHHPHLKLKGDLAPRITGVKNYYRFQNMRLLAQYQKVVKELNRQNIFPLIIKGGALKHMRPDLPRIMNDIDILFKTPKEQQTACNIAKNMGYKLTKAAHSVDLHQKENNDGFLDLHWCMDASIHDPLKLNQEIFSRAKKQEIFNTATYLPEAEDLLFITLFNLAKNLKQASCISGIIYTAFDIVYLTQSPSFNWDIVIKNIKQTRTSVSMFLAINFINRICPALISKDLINKETFQAELQRQLRYDTFYARYVFDVKYTCKKLKLLPSLKTLSAFKYYLKNKTFHFITKRFIRSDTLLKIFFRLKGVY